MQKNGSLPEALTRMKDSSESYFTKNGQMFRAMYKNWKGEIRERMIDPIYLWFGSTEWHPEPTLLLRANDLEKSAQRDFEVAAIDFDTITPITSDEFYAWLGVNGKGDTQTEGARDEQD